MPVVLFLVLGAMAAVPHLGERLLERGHAPLGARRAPMGGGVAVGLAATTMWVPPLFALVALLVGGWLLGIGLGAALGRRAAALPPGRARLCPPNPPPDAAWIRDS